MATQYETLFEAPASHEAQPYSNPYSNPELQNEWEASNHEFENEWENSNPYSNPELQNEWEANPYSNPEFAQEGEFFFKKLLKKFNFKKAFGSIGRGLLAGAKVLAPFAKQLAPMLASKLATMIPGAGVIAGPLAGQLVGQLVKEGEMEAEQMEMEFFGNNEMEAEVSNSEIAHEAALTEFLAAQAAESTMEGEAEAAIAAALPITISIMGGKRALRPVMPAMTQATGQLTKMLRQQGPAGKQLLRTMPTIQRVAAATLKAAARSGQPINSATAVKAMAAATNQVLSNPQTVQKAIVRNAVLRQRTAPRNPRRAASAAATQCPNCAAVIR
ncbi:MAG: hypothetical protein LH702_28140 [Phormidesmis sp. CAN_BIN44]|nr:hypothetical protein [Phormidesmis sp. CAN_BIN44]